MYKNYNGDSNDSNKVSTSESALSELQKHPVESIHSSEPNFRGFEKVPLILCQRIDIMPYLSKRRFPSSHFAGAEIISEKNRHIEKITQDCYVVVARDDLEKLRNEVNNKLINGDTSVKCKICSKIYSSEKKLQNHQENKHMLIYKPKNKTAKRVSFSDHIIIHEVKEYHSCRKCPKIFESYDKLKIHMKQKHKKRRCYICFYCSKEFVDRMFFKVHIKLHCDACGLLLPTKKAYNEHRRTICKIIKKYECKTCNFIFFNFLDLKDHSYEHLGTFFICDICKDQFRTKCQVGHHINFLHTKKKLTELYEKHDNEYECNFCEENFDREETVQSHVSSLPDLQNKILTGYKDFFFCDQCFSKFSTETDMLQHKWSHFLKKSDNSQEREEQSHIDNLQEREKQLYIKMTYNINEKLPDFLQPRLILEKVKVPKKKVRLQFQDTVQPVLDLRNVNFNTILKKPVVDPVSKKTIISKHRCQECGKYYSSNYCLNRHMARVHGALNNITNLQCSRCEEIFVWPSLLASHNCIRMNIPEMPFDDARPEVHFDNLHEIHQNGIEDFNIPDEDYMGVDFEIPAPIVQLTEFENLNIVLNGDNGHLHNKDTDKSYPMNGMSYKVVMQEVPIEF